MATKNHMFLTCPTCGNNDPDNQVDDETPELLIWYCTCNECGCEWVEKYELLSVDIEIEGEIEDDGE